MLCGVVDRGVVDSGVVDRGVVDRGVVDRVVVYRSVVDRGAVDRCSWPSEARRFSPLKLGDRLPPFDDVEWLDGNGPSVTDRVPVVVHFWSTGCPLCDEGATDVLAWRRRHGSRLVTIAVFAPRLDATAAIDINAVRRDARDRMHIDHACALDRDRSLSDRFDCLYAPGYFIFDAAHAQRHRQLGNDHLDAIGALVERLVKASLTSEA